MDRILKVSDFISTREAADRVSINDPMDRILKEEWAKRLLAEAPEVSINDPMDRILKGTSTNGRVLERQWSFNQRSDG